MPDKRAILYKKLLSRSLLLAIWLFAGAASAQSVKIQSLNKLQAQLAVKKAAQTQLSGRVKEAGAQLVDAQQKLVTLGAATRQNEQLLQQLEEQIAAAEATRDVQQKQLQKNRAAMGDLILTLTRLRRMPPELLLIRPGAPLATAESGELLGAILPNLRQRAIYIGNAMRQLQATQQILDTDRQAAIATRAALQGRYRQIADLTTLRTLSYQKLTGDLTQTQSEVAAISHQAETLQQLIDQLAKARADKTARARTASPSGPASPHSAYTWSMPRSGRPELPVAGRILTGYGERDRIGATSQGITLQAAAGALAVAPMGGVVRYAGPFRTYGHLVLMEHGDGYMSLIAGLDSVDAALGQSLAAGEPLGHLPGDKGYGKIEAGKLARAPSRAAAPALYYELRYHGQPVDPAVKFPDLRVKS